MDSILTSIKKMLGDSEEYTHFDQDIIININSALMNLTQLGIGPKDGLYITDNTTKWSDLIGDRKDLESVKTYIYLKTRLVFDPPANSFLIDAINKQIVEIEWRLNVQAESVQTTTTPDVQ